MGQFCNFKQIVCNAAHQMAGADLIKKGERLPLELGKQIMPHIRLHPNAEKMTPIGNDKLHNRAQQIAQDHPQNHAEKGGVHEVWHEGLQSIAGEHGKGKIYAGDEKSAGHIQNKQGQVRLIV